MRIAIIIIIPFFLFTKSYGQNKTKMVIYNISLGSVFSGFGAIINKKPNEKWGKVLLKGMYQGALGGYLVYESKNLISKIPKHEKLEISWVAKFLNSAGTSIIENAASNRDFWEKWHFNIGFNRFELYTKNQFKVKYKIMPISFIITAIIATNTKFEFKRSLQTGEFIFSKRRSDSDSRGVTTGNVITIDNRYLNDFNLFAHEIIHIYQYYDYNFLNTYLNRPFDKWKQKSKTFNKLNNLFYFDLHAPFLRGLYLLENINTNCHFDNFFEHEAGLFSNNISCKNPNAF